jgi:hypothetical protein
MNKKFDFYKLGEKEIEKVIAGFDYCVCTCAYANCGGSSTADNGSANNKRGLHSKYLTNQCPEQ